MVRDMQERGTRLPRRRLLAGLGAGLTATVVGSSSGAAQDGEEFSFGETFVAPNDVAVTVDRVELTDSYEWSGGSGSTYTEEAPDGKQFAWVYLTAENRSGDTEFLPLDWDIYIRSGNRQYDAELVLRDEGQYEGGQVGPGIVRDGWLNYEIPADLAVSDLSVVWHESGIFDEWTATWSGESQTGTDSSVVLGPS